MTEIRTLEETISQYTSKIERQEQKLDELRRTLEAKDQQISRVKESLRQSEATANVNIHSETVD